MISARIQKNPNYLAFNPMTLIWGIGRQEEELTGLGRHLRGPRNPRPQPPHRVLLPCFDGDSVESPKDGWMLTV
jgi:hypothetical protein